MKHLRILLPLLLASLVLRATAQKADDFRNMVDGVAAEVNGDPITMQDIMEQMRGAMRSHPNASPDELQGLYATALENAIRTKLVLQEYESGDMRLPDWFVDKRVSEIIDSGYGGDRSKLLAELSQQRLTFSEWREELEHSTVLMAMRQLNVDKNVHISPAQVRDHYLAHQDEFTRTAGTHLLLLQLKPKGGEDPEDFEARVATIRKRLDSEPFQEIARFFSVDPSAAKGGDWGWIQPAEMLRKELADAVDGLDVGGTSDPIATSSGVYILRKEGVREDGLQPLEAVRDEITALLRKQESERLFQEWTAKLRDKSQVRILRSSL